MTAEIQGSARTTLPCPKCFGATAFPPGSPCAACDGTGCSRLPMLYVGKDQLDPGEPDEFDGSVWALPTARERRDEAGGGPEADVYLLAERIFNEEDAARLVRCWNCHDVLVAALRNLLADTAHGVFVRGPSAAKMAEEALALAEVTP